MSSDEEVDGLVASLAARGIQLWYEGDRLRFQAPKGALDAAQRALIAGQRSRIIARLRESDAVRALELPLSDPQFMMWFQHQQAPTSTLCTIGWALRVRGPLDLNALRHAVQGLVDRHAVLRTTYHLREQGLVQRVAGVAPAAVEIHPLPQVSLADLDAAWSDTLTVHIARPIDLESGPVMRVVLFSDGAAEHLLLATFHHIAADAWSTDLLRAELLTLYIEFTDNRPPSLARPTASYAEFVRWQAGEVDGASGARQSAYWRGVLAAPRQLSVFPPQLATPAAPRFAGASMRFALDGALVTAVHDLAVRIRTTPFVVQLGAFQLLLARLCGLRDVVTGTPALGRPAAEYFSVVGNFINVLPVRSRIEPGETVTAFLARLHDTVVSALEEQHYPLSRMVQQLHVSRAGSGQRLFNTSFTMLKADGPAPPPPEPQSGTVFSWHPLVFQAGLLDLSLDILANESEIQCILKHSLSALSIAAANDAATEFVRLLGAMTARPGEALGVLLGDLGGLADDARARDLLSALEARDIALAFDGTHLKVNAPKGALDEATRQAIAGLRPAIIARLGAAAAQGGMASDFWRDQLDIPAVLALPLDRSRTDRSSARRHGVLRREVPAMTWERLSAGEAGDVGQSMLLLAAWQVLLHRYSGEDDVLVATNLGAHGEPAGSRGAIPVRGRLAGNPPFSRFLENLRRTLRAASEQAPPPAFRCQASFERVAAAGASCARGDALGEAPEALELGLEVMPTSPSGESAPAVLFYRFAADLFEEETILRLHENFSTLLESIAANPHVGVDDLPLLGAAERHRGLRDSGDVAAVARDHRCVHHQLRDSARRHPQRIAMNAADGELRYDDLEERANRLAHHLLGAGVRRGALVAVCLERTVNIPIALAAVLKAGAAYVPLDPAHPRERLRHILHDAGIAFLITQTGLQQIAEGTATRVIRLDAAAAEIAAGSFQPPDVGVRPEDLAYVIYTSGSTGKPKGVEVEHGNLASFLEAMRRLIGIGEADVLLAVTTLAFDIAGLELWLPLAVGARIVLATRAQAVDGTRLAALLEQHSVSIMQATPATWHLLLEAGWAGRRSLRALCGGEAMPPMLAAQLIERVGDLWNLYGPTETTIWSTSGRVTDAAIRSGSGLIPIGRPLANTAVRIEDATGKRVPAGVVGELLIGGAGVARGYRDQPTLTARAFVPRDEGGVILRWYRTGDLARFRGDGQLEFLGRRDQQIKLRGYRIEPAEIESLLTARPEVTSSVVILRGAAGEERLAAYLTLAAGASVEPELLRSVLRERLPDYMVPSQFTVLPTLPLTPNGKIDRAALALAEVAAGAAATSLPAVPMSRAQQRVAGLWKDVLRIERIGLNDNFFDIGGHSLLLVRIHAGLKREFGRDLPLVDLFQHTTVAQQAKVMEQGLHA